MRLGAASTFLFVPGDRPERFEKAMSSGADVVILDLEDAVAPDAKDRARAAVAAFLSDERPVIVRPNAIGTPWHEADMQAISKPGLAGVILPKSEHAGDLETLNARYPHVPLLPLIETARGFANIPELARIEGVCRFVFGTVDFQLDMGIDGEGDEWLFYRSQVVFQSRLADLEAPIDGVSLAISDKVALGVESARARRLGFTGKLCIHPAQVSVVATAFQPTEDELEKARRVVAAADTSSGVVVVDGRMVDRPVIEMARRVLRSASPAGHFA
jgi:citrate lyase subunit beta/citryl-CoA lyase